MSSYATINIFFTAQDLTTSSTKDFSLLLLYRYLSFFQQAVEGRLDGRGAGLHRGGRFLPHSFHPGFLLIHCSDNSRHIAVSQIVSFPGWEHFEKHIQRLSLVLTLI